MIAGDAGVQSLLAKGRIKKASATSTDVTTLIKSSESGLRDARLTIDDDPVRSVSQMYDAIYAACNAFMLAGGYSVVDANDYRTVLSFCEALQGKGDVNTLKEFEAAEKRRHNEMYDGCFSLTSREATGLWKRAGKFVTNVKAAILETPSPKSFRNYP
jgi:uncharacterized protein (UPF0332 family)